ncbi:MAG: A/G-specific adenine glycosylase [Spirochaetales bacterium]|nr:A/G-specific adenine glycosylase [Spirochaetales bacterium]
MADRPVDPEHPFSGIRFPELSHRLLAWFFRNKRELPWREEHDPYRIWISEVMLQQTRSETASDYYRRWLSRFPTVESLARADQEEVLKIWEGLGYYGRARNLHRSARIIADSWGGVFPETEELIRSLPGVGEYTAAAVLSIAFAKPLGVVDGNVLRVVSRLLADGEASGHGPPGIKPANLGQPKKRARALVEASFLHYHPGWINQAWMELGALVCLPKPRCPQCPLSYTCRAYREERIDAFPPRLPSRPLPIRAGSLLLLLPAAAPVLMRRDREVEPGGLMGETHLPSIGALLRRHDLPLLLVRRADSGLLGGLWELPNYPARGSELAEQLARLSIQPLLDTGTEVRHRYSHFEIRFRLIVAVFTDQRRLDSWTEQRWVLPAELDSYPRPKVHIEAMRLLGLVGD